MSNDISIQGAQPAPEPAQDEQALISQALETVFTLGQPEQALNFIAEKLNDLRKAPDDRYPKFTSVLQQMSNFFTAVLATREMNYSEAQPLFSRAAEEFQQLGEVELGNLALGYARSADAYLEIQKGNVNLALECLKQAKQYIQSAGTLGPVGAPVVGMAERDALAISAQRAMGALDYPTAKILFEQASQAAEKIAHEFCVEGSPGYNSHMGVAYYYRALSTFSQAYNRFNQFRYLELAAQTNLSSDAAQAGEFLAKGEPSDLSIKRLGYLSGGVKSLLEVTQGLAQFMEKAFRSTVKPDAEAFQTLRNKIEMASNLFAKAGQDAVSLVRFCDELNVRLDNIEKLTKPSKKDFGKFSGVIACASFLPLFLVTSWVNSAFKVGVKASTIIWYCLALALVGGFGLGALKFKTLFIGGKGAGESET